MSLKAKGWPAGASHVSLKLKATLVIVADDDAAAAARVE
jgi:hypothetical protein